MHSSLWLLMQCLLSCPRCTPTPQVQDPLPPIGYRACADIVTAAAKHAIAQYASPAAAVHTACVPAKAGCDTSTASSSAVSSELVQQLQQQLGPGSRAVANAASSAAAEAAQGALAGGGMAAPEPQVQLLSCWPPCLASGHGSAAGRARLAKRAAAGTAA